MEIPIHFRELHTIALSKSQNYKQSEAELLDIICQVRDKKVYRYFECASLFEYCTKLLKLDAGVVYGFTAVAKKSQEVPELKEKIRVGVLNVSTAKRITSVITKENKNEWFEKAENLPIRKLEKEVAKLNPREEVKERARYLNSKRISLELGLSEELMLKLRKIQDLESGRQKKSVTLEDVLEVMANEFLKRRDPVEKAKRASIRGKVENEKLTKSIRNTESIQDTKHFQGTKPANSWKNTKSPSTWRNLRGAIPSHISHGINLRDQRKCQYVNHLTKEKCGKSRFVELHHIKAVHLGGAHKMENLTTLCSDHHELVHMMDSQVKEKKRNGFDMNNVKAK